MIRMGKPASGADAVADDGAGAEAGVEIASNGDVGLVNDAIGSVMMSVVRHAQVWMSAARSQWERGRNVLI